MSRLALLAFGAFLAIAATAAAEPRDSVSREFPLYANAGRPDLTIDPKRFVSQMQVVDRLFEADSCAFREGAVGGVGVRRLLRFDIVVLNMGGGDLVVGDPADPANPYAPIFEYAPCHGHHHITGFADYRLLSADGTEVAAGHKQAFCLMDSLKYSDQPSAGYTCSNQGISAGWGDWYYKQLAGQWIDITGVPAGDYVVEATVNAARTFDEGENRYANVLRATIRVPDPRRRVDSGP